MRTPPSISPKILYYAAGGIVGALLLFEIYKRGAIATLWGGAGGALGLIATFSWDAIKDMRERSLDFQKECDQRFDTIERTLLEKAGVGDLSQVRADAAIARGKAEQSLIFVQQSLEVSAKNQEKILESLTDGVILALVRDVERLKGDRAKGQ